MALAGAPCPATVDGRPVGHAALLRLPAGARLALGQPARGLRTCLAVRGGVDVPPVLGSRATDLLSGLGPPTLVPGAVLPVGAPSGDLPDVDQAPVPPLPDDVVLHLRPGPRADWLTPAALRALGAQRWTAGADSDRVGVRLSGAPLERARDDELPSEGLVRGALQVPPDGQPVIFLADHPLTGGYPVVAVLRDVDVDRAAQVRPGQQVRLRARSAPAAGQPAAQRPRASSP